VEIADIFRDWHEEYFRRHNAPPEVIRAVHDIMKCRTPEMGGHGIVAVCPGCGHHEFHYQSCGNRNCPRCGHHKVTEWLGKRQQEMLPVNYFMATFTLPHEYNNLFRKSPAQMVNVLFGAVSESLKEFGLSKLHGTIGFMMVYQSWCRNGDFHPHVHCLIPGGALSKNEEYWLWPEKRDFLFPEKPLSRLFRGKFNALTKDLPEARAIPQSTWFKEYVVDVKCVGDSMSSFKYLAAYTQRGFIGNDRIENYDGRNVTFRYTDSRTETIKRRTVTALEFMELYLQHVMPKGFQRIRYKGFWGIAARKKLVSARKFLDSVRHFAARRTMEQFDSSVEYRCPRCKTVMKLQHSRAPPQ
jgi:hypothetical protein